MDEGCFPYSAVPSHCKVQRTSTLSSIGCQLPTAVPRDHMYRVGPAYSLNNETDIMIEIMESGPVQGKNRIFFSWTRFDFFSFSILFFLATMRVYRDFFSYRGGIYRHSAANRGDRSGFHSVRLVGWGEEQSGYSTTKYWVKFNSLTLQNSVQPNSIPVAIMYSDRSQFMGHMVGRRRLLPDTSWRQRMWNRKLRSGYVATCSFDAEKSKNSKSTILVGNHCDRRTGRSSYSVSLQNRPVQK